MNDLQKFKVPELPVREQAIKKVRSFLQKYSGSTVDDVTNALMIDWWDVYQALETLKGRGEIESELVDRGGRSKIYHLGEDIEIEEVFKLRVD